MDESMVEIIYEKWKWESGDDDICETVTDMLSVFYI